MVNFIKAYSLYIFTISLLILLVIPGLLQQGMFMDGIQYACVSRNLYEGVSSFWFPVLSKTWYMNGSAYFMEHPPLFYWAESRFFFLLGDSEYVERVFSIIMLFSNAYLIHAIWKLFYGTNDDMKRFSWLPILLWIGTPICFWTFQNNMIEMLVSLFCLLSIYFSYKGIFEKKYSLAYAFFSGLFIFLGFLTKGFPAFFPFFILISCLLIFPEKETKRKKIYIGLIIFCSVFFLFLLLVVFNNDAKQSLQFYFEQRVLSRLETTPTVNYRITLLYDLFSELIPILLISMLFYLYEKKTFIIETRDKKGFLFFLIIGLAGSLPFMLTFVQKKFYFMPAIPYFALAFSCLIAGRVKRLFHFMFSQNRVKILFILFSCSLFVISLFVSFFSIGKYSRDREVIEDTKIIGAYLPENSVISTDIPTCYSWSFHFYLLRKFNISLDPNINRSKYFVSKRKVNEYFRIRYSKVLLPTKEYHLYINTLLDKE